MRAEDRARRVIENANGATEHRDAYGHTAGDVGLWQRGWLRAIIPERVLCAGHPSRLVATPAGAQHQWTRNHDPSRATSSRFGRNHWAPRTM
jgi:hypothetical protein